MADVTYTATYNCRSLGRMYGEHWEFSREASLTANSAEEAYKAAKDLEATICGGYRAELIQTTPASSAPGFFSSIFRFFGVNFDALTYTPKPLTESEQTTYNKMYVDLDKCHNHLCWR